MPLYEVGKPYSATRSSWPDGVDYNYRAGEHELRIFLRNPTPAEILDVRKGKARFALYSTHDVIFLCYKFGSQPWSDGTYSIHLVPEDERTVPPVREANGIDRALLNVILVDGATGLIVGLRAVSFSPAFTRALEKEIREQAARPFLGLDAYDLAITRFYSAYNSKSFATHLDYASCIGGQD